MNFYGENLPFGAMITFQLKSLDDTTKQKEDSKFEEQEEAKTSKVKIEIFDEQNNLIRTLNVNAKDGLNRTYWQLDRKGIRIPRWEESRSSEEFEPSGPEVLPGKYLVKILYKNFVDSTFVNVLPDPRIKISIEDLKLREVAIQKLMDKMKIVDKVITKLKKADKNLNLVIERLADFKGDKFDQIRKKINSHRDSI